MMRFMNASVRPKVDIDLALRWLLVEGFAETGAEVRVDPSFPGIARLPSVSALRAGGVPDHPPGAVDRPRVDINAYATARQTAFNLTNEVVAYLQGRQGDTVTLRDGTRFSLVSVDEIVGPVVQEDDDSAQRYYRAMGSVNLTIHQWQPATDIESEET